MSDAAVDELERRLRAHGRFDAPPIAAAGDKIGDWKILAFLGRGGSAEVYRAENAATGIVGALKILYRADDKARARFRREARLAAELSGAAFPKFYGAGEDSGRLYLAEELLEPMELPHGDVAVAHYVLSVSRAVEELHKLGFVHRDIKPRNVMMRPSTGECVLIDLGLAKEDEDVSQMCSDTVSVVDGRAVGVGTPGFSAPEQFAGGKIGPATDIHALGMLTNVCFGGKPPRAWAKIIRRSTSSIPEQRYATVAEFARAVRHRHVTPWLWAIIAIVLLSLVLFSQRFLGLSPRGNQLTHTREQLSSGDRPLENGDIPSENVKAKGAKSAQARQDKPLTKKEFDEALLNATYDIFYSGDTNIDRKTAIELMRKGILPAY